MWRYFEHEVLAAYESTVAGSHRAMWGTCTESLHLILGQHNE